MMFKNEGAGNAELGATGAHHAKVLSARSEMGEFLSARVTPIATGWSSRDVGGASPKI